MKQNPKANTHIGQQLLLESRNNAHALVIDALERVHVAVLLEGGRGVGGMRGVVLLLLMMTERERDYQRERDHQTGDGPHG